MVDSAGLALAGVPLRITDPERIPSKRYYDEAFFELERERLWPYVWQMACRLEQIPQVGDFVEYRILDKSVIVVRTKKGIKAFHNACRHRGVQLASGHGNCAIKGFVCPFHGWRWNADGENTFVFGKHLFNEVLLEKSEIDLVPCRIETWGGCAFINFNDKARPLLECLGPVIERLEARNVDKLRTEWWCSTVLPTNWKLAMEAFMEGYHTMRTHPQLHLRIAPEANPYGPDIYGSRPAPTTTARQAVNLAVEFLATLSEGMAGMVHASEVEVAREVAQMELPEDVQAGTTAFYTRLNAEVTSRGRARGLPLFDLYAAAARGDFRPVEFMFPHFFLLPMLGSMSSYRIRPLTAETCLFEIWSLTFQPEESKPKVTEPRHLPYDSKDFPPIPRQDYSNLPLQQKGLHSDSFEYMRLSRQVEGMISNYQRLIDGHLAKLDPELLAKASQIVNSGFDAPILDIGF